MVIAYLSFVIAHVSLACNLRVILAKEVLWCKIEVVLSDLKLALELLGCAGGPDVVGMTHTRVIVPV